MTRLVPNRVVAPYVLLIVFAAQCLAGRSAAAPSSVLAI